MCDNEAALKEIAHDIKGIKEQLMQINGRLGAVERNERRNEKDIAVISTRCQLVTHYTDEEIGRLISDQQVQENRLLQFLKGNAVQLGEIIALVGLIGKFSGWW